MSTHTLKHTHEEIDVGHVSSKQDIGAASKPNIEAARKSNIEVARKQDMGAAWKPKETSQGRKHRTYLKGPSSHNWPLISAAHPLIMVSHSQPVA